MAWIQTNLPIWPQEHQPVSVMGDKDRCDPAKLLEKCNAGVAELEFHPRPEQSKEAFLRLIFANIPGTGDMGLSLGHHLSFSGSICLGFPSSAKCLSSAQHHPRDGWLCEGSWRTQP